MRLRALFFAMFALGASGFGAWKLAEAATDYVERTTEAKLTSAVADAGHDWAEITTDGLNVTLAGMAPDETARFRALDAVRQAVDPRRVSDATTVQAPDPLSPPPFALEMMRNEHEVSLVGLVPTQTADEPTVAAIRDALVADGLDGAATEILDTADHPAPPGWPESLGFGLEIFASLPRAKVSVAPGRVGVFAVADSPEAKAALEARLAAATPPDVSLDLEISAPRSTIAPFVVDYEFDGAAGRFRGCSAESPEDADRIADAARATGLRGDAECALGLGAPSPDWAEAVEHGLAALRELRGGRFSITDTEAVLTGSENVSPEALEAAGAKLDAALPATFDLRTQALPRMEKQPDGKLVHAPRFDAVLKDDGTLALSGAVRDETSRQAIASYAAARFGHEQVTDHTVIDPNLPDGWPGRVIAGIDALNEIKEGRLTVTSEDLAIEGWTIAEDAVAKIETLLEDRVEKASVSVRVDAEAAAAAARAAALAAMSRPEACADEVAAILHTGSINFRAGSSEISPESRGVIAAIADVLRSCPGAQFEVAGHTDAQGSDESNQQLSEDRARAVQFALEGQDLPLIEFRAQGYGSAYPVADNANPDGRMRNRRIEITLFQDAPPPPQPTALTPEECAVEVATALGEESIQFNLGSSEIAPESAETLVTVGQILARCPGAAFEIGGHTDDQGRAEVNQRISEERAAAVLAALEGAELPDLTLTAKGYGADRPIADNATPEGQARNRRIELTLVSTTGDAPEAVAGAEGAEAAPAAAEEPCQAQVSALLQGNTIQFAPDSAAIDEASESVIEAVAAVMRKCGGASYEIAGYTDSAGSAEVNQRISEERAEAVKSALDAANLPDVTLTSRGFGPADPVADNGTPEGRAANRRIEIELVTPPPALEQAANEPASEPADIAPEAGIGPQ